MKPPKLTPAQQKYFGSNSKSVKAGSVQPQSSEEEGENPKRAPSKQQVLKKLYPNKVAPIKGK